MGKEDVNEGGVWYDGDADFEHWNFCDEVADSLADALKRVGISAAETVLSELKASCRFSIEPEDETADIEVSLYIFGHEAQLSRGFIAMVDEWIDQERRFRSHRTDLGLPIGQTRVDDMIAALENALNRVRSAFG
jgi:hypothetical protein